MGVERLEGETPRFRVEPDPPQRPQSIAKRDKVSALRAVRSEGRGGKQNGAAGVAGVANHIRRYWEPRMRKQILAHLDAGGHGLSDLGREGVHELARMQKAAA